jgi:hypothetical protein
MAELGIKTVTVLEFTKVPSYEFVPKFTVGCAKHGPSQFASIKLVPVMVSVKPESPADRDDGFSEVIVGRVSWNVLGAESKKGPSPDGSPFRTTICAVPAVSTKYE